MSSFNSNPKKDISAKYEEERLRAQEQSQMVYMQTQIDELRRQIKDVTGKYAWAMEQARKSEALITQMQSLVERQTQEQLQTLEGYRRELTTLRKEIANNSVKVDDSVKPLRDIQLQITQQGENRKQDVQTAQSWFARIELLEQRLQEADARLRETTDQHRSLVSGLEGFREADSQLSADVRKLSEDIQVEKQNMRRQAVEAQQLVIEMGSTVKELLSRIGLLDDMQKNLEAQIVSLPEQIDTLGSQLPDIIAELKRIERVSTERFLMNQERLEELRGQQNEKIDDLRMTDETYLRQITGWLERIDAWCREHENKLARTQNRLEDVQISHLSRMQESERREIQNLQDILASFQQRLNATQAELLEKGGGV